MDKQVAFRRLTLSGWRQFRDIEVIFHPRLTVLTGANGAGKSTILKILSAHFPGGEKENFLATPIIASGKTSFSLGKWLSEQWDLFQRAPHKVDQGSLVVGDLEYSDNSMDSLSIPSGGEIKYSLSRSKNIIINGVNINSHRYMPNYEEVKNISLSGIMPKDAFQDLVTVQKHYETQEIYLKGGAVKKANILYAMKETLISFANFGTGNEHVRPIPELVGLYERFQKVLANVLPPEVGFQKLEIRTPEIVVVSSSGDFPIDGASGGLASLIQIAWQIFLRSVSLDGPFVVLIDEPENHLHPSMQRSFLSSLTKAFPDSQFIVATHSPFIISSVKESSVYALRHFGAESSAFQSITPRSVDSVKLDQFQKAGPATEILREVLGVSVTMPIWSAERLEQIISEFTGEKITKDNLAKLRAALEKEGLSEFYASALESIIK